ncbi:hypothetical protein GQE99_14545 [Maritimibacter sp. DP07]|uniref:NusG-like N-terminal domain-containing protein n=1 Tax=Maritimibacter harenae TaxID=2606218 RepID=A0A845M5E4_9RHOB|nr:hypothetical protein [Maritimibacter harenae]MZR14239.1 hypothetical protein [Maritimibacter harenae]
MKTAINYLGYAKTGHEFEVCEELEGQGIEAWAGRVIRWKRSGKKRHPDPHEEPVLPNYVFMALDDRTFHSALRVRFLANTLVMLGPADRRDLAKFQAIVEAEFEKQDRIRRNAEMPKAEFDPGQEIEIIGGPFADKIGTFRRIVERSNQLFPKLEADVGGLRLQLDPLDVRGAG